MPIFNYTFKKMIASPSTWIIMALTFVGAGIAWILPIAYSVNQAGRAFVEVSIVSFISIWKRMAFFIVLGIMLFIFIAVKTAQVLREEIDDGTLLILVSKPVSRNRIWLEKWISLMVISVIFVVVVIFPANFMLVIPGLGSPLIFVKIFPYACLLFLVSLLFIFIISSLSLLLSMVVPTKSFVAMIIGFAACTTLGSSVINGLVVLSPDSSVYAQYLQIDKQLEKSENNWSTGTKNWIAAYYNNLSTDPRTNAFKSGIYEPTRNVMVDFYKYVKSPIQPNDPYNPALELQKFTAFIIQLTSVDEKTTAIAMQEISTSFRQTKDQSIMTLLFSNNYAGTLTEKNPSAFVTLYTYEEMKVTSSNISAQEYSEYRAQLSKVRVMRYLNVFYQLKYLLDGISLNNGPFLKGNNISQTDAKIVSFKANSDGTYRVDVSQGSYDVLNYAALAIVYIIISTMLVGTSWIIFKKRDFA